MDGWIDGLFRCGGVLGHFKRWNRLADKRVQFMTVLGAGHFSKAISDRAASRDQNITPTHGFTSLSSHLNPSVMEIIQVPMRSRLRYIVSVHYSNCSVSLAVNANYDFTVSKKAVNHAHLLLVNQFDKSIISCDSIHTNLF